MKEKDERKGFSYKVLRVYVLDFIYCNQSASNKLLIIMIKNDVCRTSSRERLVRCVDCPRIRRLYPTEIMSERFLLRYSARYTIVYSGS